MNKLLSFLAAALILTGCSKKEPSLSEKIVRTWNIASIQDLSGKDLNRITAKDQLVISNQPGRSFKYTVEKDGINAKGDWALNDSIISFTYDPDPTEIAIDSTSLRVDDSGNHYQMSSDGKFIAEVGPLGVRTPRKTVEFRIITVGTTELVLQKDDAIFNMSFTPNVYQSTFGLNSILRGLLGMISLLFITYLFSSNRKAIPWKLVGSGLLLQVIFAIGVLKVPFIQSIFDYVASFFVIILGFTQEGSNFLFGNLVNPSSNIGFVFAFQILPTILFFSALTSVLFYLGILQKVVWVFAWVMKKFMRLSGAESLAAAGNIFLGQTESPLLIKPYIERMNRSEMLCLMVGGMATIAGGVLAAYIGFLGGDDPVRRLFFAKHLLAASVMSAPAAIVAAKMLLPQTEKIEEKMEISKERIGKNVLEAISNGTIDGLKLAVNVGAMLLVFIALLALVNYVVQDIVGDITGLNPKISAFTNGQYSGLTLQFILGYACAPLVWLMGVCKEDMILVGQLLGEKTILNEFVAYASLGNMEFANVFKEEKSIIIATYILCGFSNFASIGIQIGGIGSLAPNKRGMLSELGIKALIGGTIASLFTAVVVGMLI